MLLLTINIVEPLFCVLQLDQYYPLNGIKVDPCYTTNWGLPGVLLFQYNPYIGFQMAQY